MAIKHSMIDVIQAILPLLLFFLLFQFFYLKLPRTEVLKLLMGILFTVFGMALFLGGVFLGFLPAGQAMGRFFGEMQPSWVLIALGFLLGFLATFAEPAVRILCYQVESSSGGYVRSRLMLYTLSLSVAFLVALGMAKIVYGIPFMHIIIPGYLLALILLYLTDRDFIGIAFDAGGVATGPMAVTFLMSMAVGAASATGSGNSLADGFGLIALIALAPIIFVMFLGILIRHKRGGGDEMRGE
ncbi:MAG: DUF1538 domain-containing protein [Methanothrix sp.]|jgi:hypothetical protein|nr:DUF1538 domain-containing protein [Methanothrix sp.]